MFKFLFNSIFTSTKLFLHFVKSVHLTALFMAEYWRDPLSLGCPKRTSNSSIKLSGTCPLNLVQSHMALCWFHEIARCLVTFYQIVYFGHVHFWSILVYFVSNIWFANSVNNLHYYLEVDQQYCYLKQLNCFIEIYLFYSLTWS